MRERERDCKDFQNEKGGQYHYANSENIGRARLKRTGFYHISRV